MIRVATPKDYRPGNWTEAPGVAWRCGDRGAG